MAGQILPDVVFRLAERAAGWIQPAVASERCVGQVMEFGGGLRAAWPSVADVFSAACDDGHLVKASSTWRVSAPRDGLPWWCERLTEDAASASLSGRAGAPTAGRSCAAGASV